MINQPAQKLLIRVLQEVWGSNLVRGRITRYMFLFYVRYCVGLYQQTQNICTTTAQRFQSCFELYKYYTDVLCILGIWIK